MLLDVPVQRAMLYQPAAPSEGEAGVGEYSEQVLRLMHSLGVDQHKTVEVRERGRVQGRGVKRLLLSVAALNGAGCPRSASSTLQRCKHFVSLPLNCTVFAQCIK